MLRRRLPTANFVPLARTDCILVTFGSIETNIDSVMFFQSALQSVAQDLERQLATDSLKKGLEKRPERAELVESTCDVSIPLSPNRHVSEENLHLGFALLLTRTYSLSENILPDSTAAPALQGHQKELEKHMRADSLEQKIQHRPKPEELIREGILGADEDPTK